MSRFVATPRLIWFTLRLDRVRIPVWVFGIGLTVLGSVASFKNNYPTAADRQTRAAIVDNAVVKLFTGPGYGPSTLSSFDPRKNRSRIPTTCVNPT